MEFNTYKNSSQCKEKMNKESITEKTGFLSPKRQIETMLACGRALQAARRHEFDFGNEEEIKLELTDWTRRRGLDFVDIDVEMKKLKDRLNARVKEHQEELAKRKKAALFEQVRNEIAEMEGIAEMEDGKEGGKPAEKKTAGKPKKD